MENVTTKNVFDYLGVSEYLKLNGALARKKNTLRKVLNEKGILPKDKTNNFDHYKYFSEASYKLLFTGLFAQVGLELTCSEDEYEAYETNSEKQPNGKKVTLIFTLTDIETGFFEQAKISGEGMDKGDKAGYKAYTGALKYYLANNFMVATGDDTEAESPERDKKPTEKTDKASPKQVAVLEKYYTGESLKKLLEVNGIKSISELSLQKASDLITRIYNVEKAENE